MKAAASQQRDVRDVPVTAEVARRAASLRYDDFPADIRQLARLGFRHGPMIQMEREV